MRSSNPFGGELGGAGGGGGSSSARGKFECEGGRNFGIISATMSLRILYIIDRGILGGIQRHVQCLSNCLKNECEIAVCVVGNEGELGRQMREDGIKVFALGCNSGHDPRLCLRFDRLIREFRPDIIHAHVMPILGLAWLKFFHRQIPLIRSLHLPYSRKHGIMRWLDRRYVYNLAVSQATLNSLKNAEPKAKGEVFYNPIIVKETKRGEPTLPPKIGMVARPAQIKDWPSFHKVADEVARAMPVEIRNLGEKKDCPNGREMIGKMDLMLMTSFSEQMPTVVLEAMAEGTPICGFIPRGGMTEILGLSNGALREVFIGERDCGKLAQIAVRILRDGDLRERLIADGRQIVAGHFDAEKNCRGRLMEVYARERFGA